MKELAEAIAQKGVGIGKDIVKVDGFLNHRIDVQLATSMGQTIHHAFQDEHVDAILTVEASGIAVAITTAQAFDYVPVIFAKKGERNNIGRDVYSADVYSFTHQQMNTIHVSRSFLHEGDRLLLVDDFLANGEAMEGLITIARQARCEIVGAAVCVEKGFQEGGKRLRAEGIRVLSLAIVDAIEDGKIVLRSENETA